MAELAVHPRLAHMLVRAKEIGAERIGVRPRRAAVGARRALDRRRASIDSDISHRLDLMRGTRDDSANVDRDALRRARLESDRLAARARIARA